MKTDKTTKELPGLPKPRGRPASGKAMTGAKRIKKLRQERKDAGLCPCCGQPIKSP